jgi:sporulation protein YlmC with PRC-barrel domain
MLPWSAVELNADPKPDNDPNTPVGARAFYLAMSPFWIARAPAFDVASLNNLANNTWDMRERAYWGSVGVPVTGLSPRAGVGVTGAATAVPGGAVTSTPGTGGAAMTSTPAASAGMGTGIAATGSRAIFINNLNQFNVTLSDGTTLGTVQDVIMQPKTGRMQYLVVAQSNGCLLPIPWNRLDWGNAFTTGVSNTGTTGVAQATATVATGALATSTPAGGVMTDTPTAAVMTDTPAAGGLATSTTAGMATETPTSAALATSTTASALATSTPTAGTGTGTTGLGAGTTYTVSVKLDANALASAPCFANNISAFDPYRTNWNSQISQFWGRVNSQGRYFGSSAGAGKATSTRAGATTSTATPSTLGTSTPESETETATP